VLDLALLPRIVAPISARMPLWRGTSGHFHERHQQIGNLRASVAPAAKARARLVVGAPGLRCYPSCACRWTCRRETRWTRRMRRRARQAPERGRDRML